MVADTTLPSLGKLIIYGTLELEYFMNFVLNATHIVVAAGGNLIIGWKNQPMTGNVLVNLRGDRDTPEIPVQGGPNVGAKALGGLNLVFYSGALAREVRTTEHHG